MKTILVSGASGVVGYGALRSLRGLGHKLIGTTIYKESPANCFSDVFELAPKTTDAHYFDWLLGVIKKHRVDMIIPCIEADMIAWNKNRKVLENSGVSVLLNNENLISLCADKWHFYQKLKEHNSPYRIDTTLDGTFEELKEKYGLPFLLKPRCGFASKGIVKVEDQETFEAHKKHLGAILMAQPIVGNVDEEYTVSAFFDEQSKLCCFQQLRRKLSKEGFTEIAQVVFLEDIEKFLTDLAQILKPVGPTNFQFRIDGGQFKLLEINPRISSATSIRTAFGYNEAKMSVEYFLEGKIPVQPQIRHGKAIRYTEDFIMTKDE